MGYKIIGLCENTLPRGKEVIFGPEAVGPFKCTEDPVALPAHVPLAAFSRLWRAEIADRMFNPLIHNQLLAVKLYLILGNIFYTGIYGGSMQGL